MGYKEREGLHVKDRGSAPFQDASLPRCKLSRGPRLRFVTSNLRFALAFVYDESAKLDAPEEETGLRSGLFCKSTC